MAEAYPNNDDARRRLDNSIVMFNGEPYYCRWGNNGVNVKLYHTNNLNKFIHTVQYISPALTLDMPRLGYVNNEVTNTAYYFTRSTRRDQREGIPIENLMINGNRILDHWVCKGTSDMLLNIYPSIEKTIRDVIDGKYKMCAFHKDYAVTRKLIVKYRDEVEVGKIVWNPDMKRYKMEYNMTLRKPSFFVRSLSDMEQELWSIKNEI